MRTPLELHERLKMDSARWELGWVTRRPPTLTAAARRRLPRPPPAPRAARLGTARPRPRRTERPPASARLRPRGAELEGGAALSRGAAQQRLDLLVHLPVVLAEGHLGP